MKFTENLGLKKPELNDYVNVDDFNDNSDMLDSVIGSIQSDAENTKIELDEVSTHLTIDSSVIESTLPSYFIAKETITYGKGSNFPTINQFGTCITHNPGNTYLTQIYISSSGTWIRRANTSIAWGPWNKLANSKELLNKVDKINGKDLSTNDYTASEKQKVKQTSETLSSHMKEEATGGKLGHIIIGDDLTKDALGKVSVNREFKGTIPTSMSLGSNANAGGINSTALGGKASAVETSSTAVGSGANAVEEFSTSIGMGSSASGWSSTALGASSSAKELYSTAVGKDSISEDTNTTALGGASSATGIASTAIGAGAKTGGYGSIALGYNAKAEGYDSISVGSGSSAKFTSTTAVGNNSSAKGMYSTALGFNSIARETSTTAIGKDASALGTGATALGCDASARSISSTALGVRTSAGGNHSIAIGRNATAPVADTGVLGIESVKWYVPGDFTVEGTKNFEMDHPKPEKSSTHRIRHSVIETDTCGDNLYRYVINSNKKEDVQFITLPDYFIHLNKNVQIFVTPQEHFGNGYGLLNREKEQLEIHCENKGKYNILVIGTRDDNHHSVQNWDIKGVEREVGESWNGETYIFEDDEIITEDEYLEEVI